MMPGFDGTGPIGEGPMTGGGRGYCGPGRGRSSGGGRLGLRQRRRFGRGGFGWRGGHGWPPYRYRSADEAGWLEDRSRALEEELQALRARLAEIEEKQTD